MQFLSFEKEAMDVFMRIERKRAQPSVALVFKVAERAQDEEIRGS